ncbi:hypothetical protein M3Y99_00090400 [Aphelenchoides fujianensis]|nr:hypothetical protein M3Y99_00090400 [Aphelenchoides fujianensis]
MTKEKLKGLVAERDAIDGQLAELDELLKSHNVDMESPLVDAEGFPDRIARHRLRNDRKKLTDEIEELLDRAARIRSLGRRPLARRSKPEAPAVHRTSNRPFLKVENVVYGSPAFHAGLKAEDLIVQFGPFHADNFGGLQKLAEMIKEHVGKVGQPDGPPRDARPHG